MIHHKSVLLSLFQAREKTDRYYMSAETIVQNCLALRSSLLNHRPKFRLPCMAVVVLLHDLCVKGGDVPQMLFTQVLDRFFFCRGEEYI